MLNASHVPCYTSYAVILIQILNILNGDIENEKRNFIFNSWFIQTCWIFIIVNSFPFILLNFKIYKNKTMIFVALMCNWNMNYDEYRKGEIPKSKSFYFGGSSISINVNWWT